MAISPLEMNGVFTRSQDFSILKQNEDNKAMLQQSAFQNTMQKTVEKQHSQVQETEKSDTYDRRQDAKEKGKNEYHGDGGSGRRKPENVAPDGRVVRKDAGHFDFSV